MKVGIAMTEFDSRTAHELSTMTPECQQIISNLLARIPVVADNNDELDATSGEQKASIEGP